jgi:hypothetical protein
LRRQGGEAEVMAALKLRMAHSHCLRMDLAMRLALRLLAAGPGMVLNSALSCTHTSFNNEIQVYFSAGFLALYVSPSSLSSVDASNR